MRGLPLALWLGACAAPPEAPVAPTAPVTGATTLLVVLGGVSAARVAPCGGPGAMPTLDRLVSEGAALSCAAVAVSPRAMVAARALLDGRAPALPEDLRPARRPLAREAAAAGLRTVFVSADPELAPLADGFALTEVAADALALRGEGVAEALAPLLARVEPDRDALVVVVLDDATAPFPPVAASPGVPAQGWLSLTEPDGRPTDLVARWRDGRLAIDEEDRLRRRLAAGASAGLAAADAHLAAVLRAVETARGPLARLVVTSDAGFGVDAPGALGDDPLPRDRAVRVPFLVRGTGWALPAGPFPATLAWDAALGTPLPAELPPPLSGSRGRKGEPASIDLWRPDGTKLVWRDGVVGSVDPRIDPEEATLGPAPDDPAALTLLERLAAGAAARP